MGDHFDRCADRDRFERGNRGWHTLGFHDRRLAGTAALGPGRLTGRRRVQASGDHTTGAAGCNGNTPGWGDSAARSSNDGRLAGTEIECEAWCFDRGTLLGMGTSRAGNVVASDLSRASPQTVRSSVR